MKILTMRYGPRWKTARKLFHGILHINVAKTYVPYQSLESKQMLHEILEAPTDFFDSLKRYSGSLTAQMTYGWRTPDKQDLKMKLMYESLGEYLRLNHTGFAAMADFFPVLRVLPAFLMPTKAAATRLYEEQKTLFLGHWYEVKRSIQEGASKPCQAVDLARLQEKEKFSDEEAAFLIGELMTHSVSSSELTVVGNGLEAGADTTASVMYTFVQAMILYPEVQKTAQAQIELVCGNRLPEMDDIERLPYIRCIMKETLRWLPTAILGAVVRTTFSVTKIVLTFSLPASRYDTRRPLPGTPRSMITPS